MKNTISNICSAVTTGSADRSLSVIVALIALGCTCGKNMDLGNLGKGEQQFQPDVF
jgi:hypothetical protein